MPQVCCALKCNHTSMTCKLKRFPSDETKRKKWIANVQPGKHGQFKEYHRICECHFDESQFEANRADGMRKLKPNAVPTVFECNNLKGTKKRQLIKLEEASESSQTIQLIICDTQPYEIILEDEPETTEVSDEKLEIQKANLRLRTENFRLKKELSKLRARERHLTDHLKLFRPDQIEHMTKKVVRKWSKETVVEALEIRSACGLSGYNFLLKKGWPYPSYETLCRRIREIPLTEDGDSEVINLMKADGENASLPDYDLYYVLSSDDVELEQS